MIEARSVAKGLKNGISHDSNMESHTPITIPFHTYK